MAFISKIFSLPLLFFYNITGNYGVAVILFALMVKLLLMPFQMKSKRSMMRTTSIAPRLKELEKKYEGNQQKYNEEVSRIYKEEKINPMSGCLWSLIPFPILIALYSVIRRPLTYMMDLGETQIASITDKLIQLGKYVTPATQGAYEEITIANLIHENFSAVQSVVPDVLDINYNFLGMNLGSTPQWNFFMNTDWGDVAVWLPALGLFLIPLISGGLSFLQMQISNKNSAGTGDAAANQMKGMTYMMPLVSVYIAFIMPGALGIYWIAQSLFGIVQDVFMNKYYGKKLAAEEEERTARFRAREEELERKRAETERLRAEGKTHQNPNTSKRKRQSLEKAKEEDRLASEREARRLSSGEEQPESQVGKRRYARGRAYVADRFTNPESAEAATAAAAAESEYGEAIDEQALEADTVTIAELPEVAESESGEDRPDTAGHEPWEAKSDKEPWEN